MTKKLTIEGMSCKHCVKTVTDVLSSMPEVAKAKVDLKTNSAFVKLTAEASALDGLLEQKFKSVIEEAGYELTAVENGG
ncbi:MAG: heavy-metal-associated domain-containing protein [Oscillospiraceae bacterium]|jgi:copper chaperone CopZ|nr:heavy-metal-associated domain-containing protein [Oscillospiraceae bacterium]